MSRRTTVALVLGELESIGRGGTVLDPDVVSHLLSRSALTAQLARLSARAREVLELMAEGLSNAARAERLVIDVKWLRA